MNKKLTTLGYEEFEKLKLEWEMIDTLVIKFQKQFKEDSTIKDRNEANECGNLLLEKFSLMFLKYIQIIKYKNIDWTDSETKEFLLLFIESYELKKALRRKKINAENRNEIYDKFNFVTKTYGSNTEEEILSDLNTCLLILAKRYKAVGKNFCSYVYNVFKHEVGRHIKRWIKNPLNVMYKNSTFEDWKKTVEIENQIIDVLENNYELTTGLPDITWINGQTCSKPFKALSTFQRRILVKYYLEGWSDRIIAESFGANINTINHNRRVALSILCEQYNIDNKVLKRSRNVCKRINVPIFG